MRAAFWSTQIFNQSCSLHSISAALLSSKTEAILPWSAVCLGSKGFKINQDELTKMSSGFCPPARFNWHRRCLRKYSEIPLSKSYQPTHRVCANVQNYLSQKSHWPISHVCVPGLALPWASCTKSNACFTWSVFSSLSKIIETWTMLAFLLSALQRLTYVLGLVPNYNRPAFFCLSKN